MRKEKQPGAKYSWLFALGVHLVLLVVSDFAFA
jgi:hypothetical protein